MSERYRKLTHELDRYLSLGSYRDVEGQKKKPTHIEVVVYPCTFVGTRIYDLMEGVKNPEENARRADSSFPYQS